MKPINKRMWQWFLGGTLIITCVLVWWVQVYRPLKDQRDKLEVELFTASQQRDRLKQRQDKLLNTEDGRRRTKDDLSQLKALVVPGKDTEEVTAYTQLWVQEFLQGHDLYLSTYRGLDPSKWRDYELCRVRFRINATTQGLSDLLKSLEKLEKAISIEKFSVAYNRSRERDLGISLELGAIFVKGLRE